MSLGYVGFSQLGNVTQQSPTIWADCLNTILNDKGFGYYAEQDFLGVYQTPAATTTAPGIETVTGVGTNVFGNAASGTYGPNVLSMATGASAGNNTGIFFEELGQIQRNSGRKFWFEARVAWAALTDSLTFIGLAKRADINTATNGLLHAGSYQTAANQDVGGNFSVIGFITRENTSSAVIQNVNAIYRKTTSSTVTVLADVTNATALQAEQAAQPTGVVITQAAAVTAQTTNPIGDGIQVAYGNLVAASFRKFGVRFDGYTKIEFYVDGVLVARQEVDSTVDQTAYYCPVIAVRVGSDSAAAQTVLVDWIGGAFSLRS